MIFLAVVLNRPFYRRVWREDSIVTSNFAFAPYSESAFFPYKLLYAPSSAGARLRGDAAGSRYRRFYRQSYVGAPHRPSCSMGPRCRLRLEAFRPRQIYYVPYDVEGTTIAALPLSEAANATDPAAPPHVFCGIALGRFIRPRTRVSRPIRFRAA